MTVELHLNFKTFCVGLLNNVLERLPLAPNLVKSGGCIVESSELQLLEENIVAVVTIYTLQLQ